MKYTLLFTILLLAFACKNTPKADNSAEEAAKAKQQLESNCRTAITAYLNDKYGSDSTTLDSVVIIAVDSATEKTASSMYCALVDTVAAKYDIYLKASENEMNASKFIQQLYDEAKLKYMHVEIETQKAHMQADSCHEATAKADDKVFTHFLVKAKTNLKKPSGVKSIEKEFLLTAQYRVRLSK